jgi:alpha-tubulin suppressor-like RCC1 family protein
MRYTLLILFILGNLQIGRAQCPDVYSSKKKVASSFHSSLMIDYNNVVRYWGETSNPTTGLTTATPTAIPASQYTGTPVMVAASSVGTGGNGHQMYLLTSDSLYGWGSITGSVVFTPFTTISLPATKNGSAFQVKASDIEFITNSGGGLALVLKMNGVTNGEVYVRNPSGTGGGSASTYGDGTTTTFDNNWHQVRTNPTTFLNSISKLSHSQKAMMAIGASNTIYTWGMRVWVNSTAGDYYYATPITNAPAGVAPVDVNVITRVEFVDTTARYATQFILGNDKKLYAIGEGFRGILGQGLDSDATSYLAVKNSSGTGDLTNIVQISSNNVYVYKAAVNNQNYYAIGALNADGQMFMWGDNSLSMIGGSAAYYQLPAIPPNFNVNDARVGYFCVGGHTTLAFLAGSNRFCYVGHRTQGSMGDGTTASTTKSFFDCINTPNAYVCPPPNPLGCATASASDLLASSVNGTVVINGQPAASYWGSSASSADAGQNTPLPITLYEYNGSPKGVAASGVSATNGTQMWIHTSTGIWGWGYSANTVNSAAGYTSLTKMALPSGVTISNVAFIRSSKGGLALVTATGEVWIKAGANSACNANVYGDGSTALDNNWHQVTTAAATPLTGIAELSFSGTAAMAIGATGSVYTWGTGSFLGDGSAFATRNRAALMSLHSDFTVSMLPRKGEIIQTGANGAAYYLLGTNNKVYVMGGNLSGNLGIGSTNDQNSWTALALTNIKSLSCNNPFPNGVYSVGALSVTGTLYLWGSNQDGVLGAGSAANITTPTVPPLAPLGAGVTAIDNISGFEMGGSQTIIFTKPLSANPSNKFLFAGINSGGAKGDVSPAPTTSTITSFAFGGSVINCAGDVYSLSGNVYYDANGLNDAGGGLISGPALATISGAPALYANLLDENGNVVNSTPVLSNGTYAFSSLPAATYTVQLATTAGALFNPAPPAGLSAAWGFSGEQIGTAAGSGMNTGANLMTGRMSVTLGVNISNVNFGVEKAPGADEKSFTVAKWQFQTESRPAPRFPGRPGYCSIAASDAALSGYTMSGGASLSGSDPEDCATAGSCNTGSGRSFYISAIKANTELWYYNGTAAVQILAGQTIANFDKANLVIYGQAGTGNAANPVSFSYSLADAAGVRSAPAAYSVNTGAVVLPVRLMSFAATVTNSCTAAIRWTTATESDIDRYEIQHSADGHLFTTAGTQSPGRNEYSFEHAGLSRGDNFYRLQIIGTDGSVSFSNTLAVKASCLSMQSLSIAPNPASSSLNITGISTGDVVDIVTLHGELAARIVSRANGLLQTDISALRSGIYLVRVRDMQGSQIATVRLSKL